MTSEGRITIDLSSDGEVRLQSSRPTQIGRMFEGRRPDDVLQLLPMVYAICARAHVAAARQALPVEASETQMRADALAVLAENAREHLLRILLGWRSEVDMTTAPASGAMALVARMTATENAASERAVADALGRLLADHLLGMAPERFLEISNFARFHDWVLRGRALAPRNLAQVIDRGWQGIGAAPLHFLSDLPGVELLARLSDPDFAGHPDWQGQPCETGPLARHRHHPLVIAVIAEHGAGLLARLVARLVDLAQIPQQMRNPVVGQSGTPGLGIVETARGRLIHAATVEDGVVANYRILAPTEWNFHPTGAAVQSLRRLTPGHEFATRARALVEAIDPCVDFEVRVA